MAAPSKGRLGILVGGGPAPGINGVIGAVTIEATHRGLEVLGLYDGFRWLAKRDSTHAKPLTIDDVALARFRGGSMLRTSRETPAQDRGKLRNVVATLKRLGFQVRHHRRRRHCFQCKRKHPFQAIPLFAGVSSRTSNPGFRWRRTRTGQVPLSWRVGS
jgi:hypothetical protein